MKKAIILSLFISFVLPLTADSISMDLNGGAVFYSDNTGYLVEPAMYYHLASESDISYAFGGSFLHVGTQGEGHWLQEFHGLLNGKVLLQRGGPFTFSANLSLGPGVIWNRNSADTENLVGLYLRPGLSAIFSMGEYAIDMTGSYDCFFLEGDSRRFLGLSIGFSRSLELSK